MDDNERLRLWLASTETKLTSIRSIWEAASPLERIALAQQFQALLDGQESMRLMSEVK